MFASMLLAAALATAPPSQADTAHLVIVATTDVHGRAFAWDYTADRSFPGGLTRVATVVDSLRAAYPGQVLLVDAGDLIQGDPFAAYFARVAPRDTNPVIRAMNLLGYDAATLGNHEFNWGLATLARALAGATYPLVNANIRGLPRDTLAYRPYVVLTRQGVRVGITGFTTPGVMIWDRTNVAGRVRLERIDDAARRVLPALRSRSDFDIVLVHSGMDGGSSYDTTGVGPENVAASLAALPARPDLVVVGHSHREIRDSVLDGVHFIQPKNWAQSVVVMHVHLARAGGGWKPVAWHADLVPLAQVPPEPRMVAALQGAHDSVRAWVRQPLATSSAAMPASLARARPTPVIGFIQSVQREVTGADLSAASAFNLDGGFPAGAVHLSDVAGIYPYENTLRAVRISGGQLKAFLEQSARYYLVDSVGTVAINPEVPGYNFDMISGASYVIDLSRPMGDRITYLVRHGKPIQPTDSFTLAVNSYRQEGGGGFTMLKGAPVVYDRGENVRDLLAEHLTRLRTITPATYDERNWSIVPAEAAAQVVALQREPDPKGERRLTGGRILLRILTTNDLHGALSAETAPWSHGREVGGLAVLDALMDSAATQCGCTTLRLDAGDQMQGTLASNVVHGRSMVQALNMLRLDAAAVGNHDLDWTVDTLRARMGEARYPWLAANVYDSTVHGRPDWARPFAMLQAGSLRVAVIGYLTDETRHIVRASNVTGLAFPGGAAALAGVLDTVHALHPDLVVLIAHAGATCDSAGCRGEITRLARDLPPGAVDAIVAGHTHQLNDFTVNGIPIVQARSSGTALGVMDLVADPDGTRHWRTAVQDTYAAQVTPDSAEAALVARFEVRVDSVASRQITTLAAALDHAGAQYPLGNLIADAQRAVARADVAIMNNGGIRGDLPEGPVTYRDLYQLQPFGNGLVRARVRGRVLRAALEFVVGGRAPSAHVSGATVVFDPAKPAGHRLVSVRLADGRPLQDDRLYTLAVNDFMSTGGSGFTLFNGLPWQSIGMTDLEALVAWLERQPRPVRADSTLRIRTSGR